jgi:hypothetical protein
MKSTAVRAQMESEDVAALSVRRTGDRAMSTRKTSIEDLTILEPDICRRVETSATENTTDRARTVEGTFMAVTPF